MTTPPPRPLTFVEEARRRQIVDCTIDLMADRGYAGTALSAIAGRAGISKGAVLYHFASKGKVIEAALMHVYTNLAAVVGDRVEKARDPVPMLVAYLRGLMSTCVTTRGTFASSSRSSATTGWDHGSGPPAPRTRTVAGRRWPESSRRGNRPVSSAPSTPA